MINKDRKFDLRTLDRSLETGRITQAQYDEFLKELPDVADNAAPVEAEYVEGVLKAKSDD